MASWSSDWGTQGEEVASGRQKIPLSVGAGEIQNYALVLYLQLV